MLRDDPWRDRPWKRPVQEAPREETQELAESRKQEWLLWEVDQGRRDDLAVLERVFERRVGRRFIPRERRTLFERLGSLGPERIGEVLFDLPPDALALWIVDPKAT